MVKDNLAVEVGKKYYIDHTVGFLVVAYPNIDQLQRGRALLEKEWPEYKQEKALCRPPLLAYSSFEHCSSSADEEAKKWVVAYNDRLQL